MLAQATDLVIAIFGPGAGEGQDMVDGMTGKLEGWRRAIEADPEKVEGFFEHSVETTGEFLQILGMIAEQWFVVAQAMEPVDEGIHDIATALNSIRIGNVSGLTLLLGAFTGLALGKKALELADLLKAYKGIQSVMKGEAALADILAGREVAAAGRVVAANYGVVDSIAAQQTAQSELLIANSSGAITGSVPIGGRAAGEAEAGMMAKGLGLALPAAIAGIGIANIVTSATAGDWHDAGWEAGGSLAGGVAGFFVGGPAGAMIGAGVGSVLGEAFDHGLADAFEGHASQHHLEQVGEEQAEQFIHGWNRHRKQIRKEISTGFLGREGTEPHTVAGPSSYVPGFGTVQGASALVGGRKGTGLRGRRQELREAIHQDASPAATKVFERELAAVEKAIAATKRARATFAGTIDQMQGDIALGMSAVNQDLARGLDQADAAWGKGTKPWRAHTAEAMEDAVAAIKTGIENGTFDAEKGQKRINELLARIHLVQGDDPFGLAEATTKQFKQVNEIAGSGVRDWKHKLEQMPPAARSTSIDATNKMLKAWAEGHPKLEHQLDALTAMEIQKFGATNQQLREGVKKGATGPVAEAFRQMALGNMDALDNLGVNLNRMLKALGAKDLVQFQAMVLGPARHSGTQLNSEGGGANFAGNAKHHELATGGRVRGVTEGDSVERMVPPNTFILNREASRYFFQDGGHIPVVLEPGEIEFGPEAVNSIGLDTLLWMNSAVPRFANGGEVAVSGPRALAAIGHAGLGKVVTAMNRYIDAHRPKVGAGGANVPAGKGTEVMDGYPVADWIWKILEAARHAGVDFTVSSGFRTDAEQLAIWNSGVRPAAKPKALGGPGSNHEGTVYPAGAVDIAPGADALDAWLEHSRWANTLIYAGAKDPVHFSHPHGGGYQRGGVVGPQRLITGGEALNVPTHIAPTPPSKSTKEAEGKGEEKTFIDATSTQENVALRVARDLLGYGLNYKGAAGVIGNAWRESRWNPASEGTGGGGLWGFTTSPISLADLKAAASTKGVAWDDIDFQTSFMWNSPGNASSLKSALNAQPSAASAAHFFDSEWEHSGIKAMPEREDGAREALRLMTHSGEGLAGGDYTKPSRPAEPNQVKGKYTYPGYAPKGTKAGGLEAKKVTRHGHYKVATEHLSFGSLPDNLKACNDELHHRRKQLREYRGALADAEDNRVRRDLEFNVAALEDRIRKLKRQRVKLIRKREQGRRDLRVKHEVERIEGMADFSAWTDPSTGIFAREEAAFDLAEERASQAVELEPEEPRVPGSATGNETRDILGQWIEHVLAPYVEGTETARYQDVLGVEASWRNSIIGAEAFAEKRIGDWGGRIEHLNDRIDETRERIHKQTDRVHHIQDRIKKILGYKDDKPDAWEKHKDELPDLRAKVQKLQGKIGRERGEIPGFEQFIAALTGDITKTQSETLPEWEQMLGGVQGLGRGHEVLGSLPGDPSTQFGGDIFQTQMTIHELGLKVPNAIAALPEVEKPEGPDRTEQVELELELSKQANQRLLIENTLLPTLSQFEHSYPLPYMGAFADGGVALVGERGPELAHFPSGTRVHTAADTQSMLAPNLHVAVNGDIRQEPGDTRPPIEAWLADPRNQKIIQRIAVATPRPLSNTAPGRAYSA
jgi:predicted  nucleic acid-binding Zn-ribbon protein